MKQKLFSLLFAIVASVGTIFASVTIDGIAYNLNETELTAEVTSGGSYSGSVTIPESIIFETNAYNITSIGNNAFNGCSSLTSVTIPNSVTSIGYQAFYGCSGLTKVNISDIAAWCNISFRDGSANPLFIAHNLFLNDEVITELIIPESVTSIGTHTFRNCSSLISVTIPNRVTSIGNYAFSGCSNLTVFVPNSTATSSNTFTDCKEVIHYEQILDDFVFNTNNGIWSLVNYIGNDRDIILPDNIQGESYELADAFKESNITSIIISNGVTSIGFDAFRDCDSLTSVTIPNSVTRIREGAFSGCTSLPVLDNIRYADSYLVEVVDNFLATYTIRDGTKWIGPKAFSDCVRLSSIDIPSSVTSIASSAFLNCANLKKVNISDLAAWCNISFSDARANPLSLAYHLFLNDEEIINLIIPDSVTCIGNRTFYGCSGFTSVTIPSSVTSIGEEAFYGCRGLASVTIPNSITSIENKAFYGCSGLASIEIPNSVISIENSAFRNCSSLTSVTIGDGVTTIGPWAFGSCESLTSIEIPNSVTSIGFSAFNGCSNLISVTIPNSVTSISLSTFSGCSSLTSLSIPNSVITIGESAFSDCSSLTSVVVPSSVTNVWWHAFSGCSSLKVYVPNSTTTGTNAFTNCKKVIRYEQIIDDFVFNTNDDIWSLVGYIGNDMDIQLPDNMQGESYTLADAFRESDITSIVIPNSITSIEDSAFYGSHGLTSVELNSNAIASAAYSSSSSIKSIFGSQVREYILGDAITGVGIYAFYGCRNLTHVTIPCSVTSIGNYAFYGCTNLTSVTLNSNAIASINYWYNNYYGTNNSKDIFGAQVQEYIIGDSVTTIGKNAFRDCVNLKSVIIGNNVTTLGNMAFCDCSNLRNVVLGESVTSLGSYAFENNTKLETLVFKSQVPPSIGGACFDNDTCDFYVPCGTIDDYKAAQGLSAFSNRIMYKPFNYEIIASAAVEGTGHVVIPQNYCEGLEAVPSPGAHFTQWSDGNTDNPRFIDVVSDTTFMAIFEIDNNGTCGEDNLLTWSYNTEDKQLTIDGDGSLNSNYNYALAASAQATDIIIGNGVTYVGDSAFVDFAELVTLSLGENISRFGEKVFAGCPNIATIYNYHQRPAKLGADAFKDVDYFYCTLYVPEGSANMYKSSGSDWKDFYFIEEMLETPTAIDDATSIQQQAQKFIRNGQLFILRDGKTYNLQGQEVK